MRAIRDIHNRFFIFPDNTIIYDKALPAEYYRIRFDKQLGFYLDLAVDFDTNVEKMYGSNKNKIDKIISRYRFNIKRNIGAIFSGQKGLGKSLTAKTLCIEMHKLEYPIIIIDENIYGISKFLHKLRGDYVILLEEFEKVFPSQYEDKYDKNSIDTQEDFLTIFDNMENDHKLFIMTCNKLRHLSDLFINRPGRFYYNIHFKYPTENEIIEYLNDNLNEKYKDQISEVVNFSKKMLLNYDSLRALSSEINFGLPFKEAIKDLNILKVSDNSNFYIEAEFNSVEENIHLLTSSESDIIVDFFNPNLIISRLSIANTTYSNRTIVQVTFNTKNIKIKNNEYYLNPEDVQVSIKDETYAKIPDFKLTKIRLKRFNDDDDYYNHYNI